MIFQHTHQWIFGVSPYTGKPKTMTSRLWQPDWYTWMNGEAIRDGNPEHDTRENCPKKYSSIHRESNNRVVYREGQRHAVQPGRTQKGIGHIQIATLYRYDVRTITPYELECEGFPNRRHFLDLWASMHDAPAFNYLQCDLMAREYQRQLSEVPGHIWDAWDVYLRTRPRDKYLAVAIRFDPVIEQDAIAPHTGAQEA